MNEPQSTTTFFLEYLEPGGAWTRTGWPSCFDSLDEVLAEKKSRDISHPSNKHRAIKRTITDEVIE